MDPGRTVLVAVAEPRDALALLRATRAGDAQAYETLLLTLRLPMRRYLRARFRFAIAPEMCYEDIEQDALLHVHVHLPDCRAETEGALIGWALAIARRAALDVLREPFETRSLHSSVVMERLADDAAGPDAEETPVSARRLVEAQQWLPAVDQELLWRRLVRRESWVEVGAALGLSWTAARRRFQRAQQILRRHAAV